MHVRAHICALTRYYDAPSAAWSIRSGPLPHRGRIVGECELLTKEADKEEVTTCGARSSVVVDITVYQLASESSQVIAEREMSIES